jgi:hypothetical protein
LDWPFLFLFSCLPFCGYSISPFGSHFVGDWRDLFMHHLKRRHGRYQPNPDYRTTDPGPIGAATTLCLRVLRKYLQWNRSDPDNYVRLIVDRLEHLNQRLDDAHETYLQVYPAL